MAKQALREKPVQAERLVAVAELEWVEPEVAPLEAPEVPVGSPSAAGVRVRAARLVTHGAADGSGGSGGAACTNTDSDKLNCGACGHSCLGGDCSARICQPLLLGTIPSAADAPRQTVVSGGKVYVFTQVSRGATGNAWQFDADKPSTPTEVMTGGAVSCAMNGQLFWVDSTTLSSISACTFSNCHATMTEIVTLASNDVIRVNPACDASNGEIVWATTAVGGILRTTIPARLEYRIECPRDHVIFPERHELGLRRLLWRDGSALLRQQQQRWKRHISAVLHLYQYGECRPGIRGDDLGSV